MVFGSVAHLRIGESERARRAGPLEELAQGMEAAVLGSWLSNLLNMARYGSKRAYGPRALSHRVWRAWASPCAASSRPTSSESIEAAW